MPMARNTTSNMQRDGYLRGCALATAQIIQFAPYFARKQEQRRFLARLNRHSPVAEGDIRAWVAAIVEWSARYSCAEPSRDYEEFIGAKKHLVAGVFFHVGRLSNSLAVGAHRGQAQRWKR